MHMKPIQPEQKKQLTEHPTCARYHMRHIYNPQAWKAADVTIFQFIGGRESRYLFRTASLQSMLTIYHVV